MTYGRTQNINLAFQAKTTGWEVTLERQKMRAEALANEFGALVEYTARKVLGTSHYASGCIVLQHLHWVAELGSSCFTVQSFSRQQHLLLLARKT